MRTAIIDYGVGNLASAFQGARIAGLDPVVTSDQEIVRQAAAVILPGVGAFAQGMENLRRLGMIPLIREAAACHKPLLGICLGMQLFFENSEEHGRHGGLGLLPGSVRRFPGGLKVPHMGWNTLLNLRDHPLLSGIPEHSFVYFVHSYYAEGVRREHVAAWTNYGLEFPAVVCFNNIVGVQFHPEKSSQIGLRIMKNFGELVRNVSNPSH